MRPLEAVPDTRHRLGGPAAAKSPRSPSIRLPNHGPETGESASRSRRQVLRCQLRRECSSFPVSGAGTSVPGARRVCCRQLTVHRKSNCAARSVAWTIANVSPCADCGKPPMSAFQKSLRKTRLVALVSCSARGNSLSVWAGLSRSWVSATQAGPRILPRMTVRTLPAAKSEPVRRNEPTRLA